MLIWGPYLVTRVSDPEFVTESDLLEDAGWLVRLRWIATLGIVVTAAVAAALRIVPSPVPMLAVATLMAGFNLALWLWLLWKAGQKKPTGLEGALVFQLLLDLLWLTALIHLSGGVENPFVMFFAFHMAIAAMFLPSRQAWGVGSAAALFHGGAVLAEYHGLLTHHALLLAWPHPPLSRNLGFVSGYLIAFLFMLGGTIYFVQSIAERHRRAERLRREHERIALSRERLARVGELAAGVAHTTRNPLHGLMNSVEILQRRLDLDDETREILSLMSDGLRRIESVTRRLLVLTREAPLQKAPSDVGALVKDALRFVEPRARQRAILLQAELVDSPTVYIDPDRMSEALINILDNAMDACRSGGEITVKTWLTKGTEAFACIEIADSGEGVPEEHLKRVFDPFFTTKAVGEGSGLGLAVTRKIVEQHGGEVSLSSRAGEGTQVRIMLPAVSPEERQEEVSA